VPVGEIRQAGSPRRRITSPPKKRSTLLTGRHAFSDEPQIFQITITRTTTITLKPLKQRSQLEPELVGFFELFLFSSIQVLIFTTYGNHTLFCTTKGVDSSITAYQYLRCAVWPQYEATIELKQIPKLLSLSWRAQPPKSIPRLH
jgi:hypothetical protein